MKEARIAEEAYRPGDPAVVRQIIYEDEVTEERRRGQDPHAGDGGPSAGGS